MKLRLGEQQQDDIDMTPMIDIVFQLIIFFMIASSFVEEAKVYKVSVPKAEAPETISTEEARTIAVTKDGDVAPADTTDKNARYESLVQLVEELKAYKALREKDGKEAVVVIAGDKDANYARVIQVWNAIKNAGIRQVSFQVEPGKAE
ncbi:MAG: biopolymer transporter ExbD [Planctomycetota bacterium]|nr:biopolymer transporter ExbD [Planctomycetota bacterium]